jgi:uncharacterized Ntn-hydrolase superfamily protein
MSIEGVTKRLEVIEASQIRIEAAQGRMEDKMSAAIRAENSVGWLKWGLGGAYAAVAWLAGK